MPRISTLIRLFSYLWLSPTIVFAAGSDLTESGLLRDIEVFVKQNPDKVENKQEKISDEPKKIKELPIKLPKNLIFLDYKAKPFPDLKEALEVNPKIVAEWLKKEELIPAFDKRYEEFQEFILIHPEKISENQKEKVELLFEKINQELNTLLNVTAVKNHDETLLGPLAPTSDYKPPSMKQVGEIPGQDLPDGTSNIRVQDNAKGSVFRKPSFGGEKGPAEEEKIASLNLVSGVCQEKASKKIVNIDLKILSKNVENLERALIDESNPIEERIQIYCTLLKFYELTENSERLIDFLYLNMPADDIKCP